ncbi:MAG: InlB B-repeat-containing protein [Defluviitaleaceae bacterium]|nr:InlB B-repeat-containing protein [Defluviitaleaceae bacterium]
MEVKVLQEIQAIQSTQTNQVKSRKSIPSRLIAWTLVFAMVLSSFSTQLVFAGVTENAGYDSHGRHGSYVYDNGHYYGDDENHSDDVYSDYRYFDYDYSGEHEYSPEHNKPEADYPDYDYCDQYADDECSCEDADDEYSDKYNDDGDKPTSDLPNADTPASPSDPNTPNTDMGSGDGVNAGAGSGDGVGIGAGAGTGTVTGGVNGAVAGNRVAMPFSIGTIHFNPMGGQLLTGDETSFLTADGRVAVFPQDPTLDGYAFIHWVISSSDGYGGGIGNGSDSYGNGVGNGSVNGLNGRILTPSTVITVDDLDEYGNLAAYAVWGLSVSFHLGGIIPNNMDVAGTDPTNVTHLATRVVLRGETISHMADITGIVFPVNPTSATNTFLGWHVVTGGVIGDVFTVDTVINSNLEIQAVWAEGAVHTITFNAGDGTISPSDGGLLNDGSGMATRLAHHGMSIHRSSRTGEGVVPLNQHLTSYRFGAPVAIAPAGFHLEGWWTGTPDQVARWWTEGNFAGGASPVQRIAPPGDAPIAYFLSTRLLPSLNGRSNVEITQSMEVHANWVARIEFVANGGQELNRSTEVLRMIPRYLVQKNQAMGGSGIPAGQALLIDTLRGGDSQGFTSGLWTPADNPTRRYGLPALESPQGREFLGWTVQANLSHPSVERIYHPDHVINVASDGTFTSADWNTSISGNDVLLITQSLHLYAQWAEVETSSSVTFHLPEGAIWRRGAEDFRHGYMNTNNTANVPVSYRGTNNPLTINCNGTGMLNVGEMPAHPVKLGYIFMGWYVDDIPGTLNLPYLLDAMGEYVLDEAGERIRVQLGPIQPELNPNWSLPAWLGFRGTSNNNVHGQMPIGGVHLAARFRPAMYIQFDPNGGTDINRGNTFVRNVFAGDPTNPVAYNPNVIPWAIQPHLADGNYTHNTHNNIMNWVGPNVGGGFFHFPVSTGQAGITSRVGYRFMGWNLAPDGSGSFFTGTLGRASFPGTYAQAGIIGGPTIYATWGGTLTFNDNRNSQDPNQSNLITTQEVMLGRTIANNHQAVGTPNTPLSLPAPVLFGHTFIGWHTHITGDDTLGHWFDATTVMTQNTTVFAQWVANTGIMFHRGFGPAIVIDDYGMVQVQGVINGQDSYTRYVQFPNSIANTGGDPLITAPAGVSFLGWNTRMDGSGITIDPNSSYMFPHATVLFAQWYAVINFDAGLGGLASLPSGEPLSRGIRLGNPLNERFPSIPTVHNNNWEFVHWSNEPNGDTPLSPTTNINSATSLYAVWQADVTFVVDGDDVASATLRQGRSLYELGGFVVPDLGSDYDADPDSGDSGDNNTNPDNGNDGYGSYNGIVGSMGISNYGKDVTKSDIKANFMESIEANRIFLGWRVVGTTYTPMSNEDVEVIAMGGGVFANGHTILKAVWYVPELPVTTPPIERPTPQPPVDEPDIGDDNGAGGGDYDDNGDDDTDDNDYDNNQTPPQTTPEAPQQPDTAPDTETNNQTPQPEQSTVYEPNAPQQAVYAPTPVVNEPAEPQQSAPAPTADEPVGLQQSAPAPYDDYEDDDETADELVITPNDTATTNPQTDDTFNTFTTIFTAIGFVAMASLSTLILVKRRKSAVATK